MLIDMEMRYQVAWANALNAALPARLSMFEVETLWEITRRCRSVEAETTTEEWAVVTQVLAHLEPLWMERMAGALAQMARAGICIAENFVSSYQKLEAQLASAPQVVRT